MELIDPSLRGDPQISKIVRCLQIALLCIQPRRVDRPTMSDVVMMLNCESMILPALPASVSRDNHGAGDESSSGDASETAGDAAGYTSEELNSEDDDDDDDSCSYLSCCSDGVDNAALASSSSVVTHMNLIRS